MPRRIPAHHRHLSQLLHDVVFGADAPQLTVGEIVDRLEDRGVAVVLGLLALPIALPIPMPGISAVFGLPMLLISLQLAVQRHRLWLPDGVRRRAIDRARMAGLAQKAISGLRRIERFFLKPRLQVLCHPLLQSLYALICAGLALILFLPVPFGNVLPSLSIFVISLAILEKDGLAAVAGVLLAGTSVFVTAGATVAVAKAAWAFLQAQVF